MASFYQSALYRNGKYGMNKQRQCDQTDASLTIEDKYCALLSVERDNNWLQICESILVHTNKHFATSSAMVQISSKIFYILNTQKNLNDRLSKI